MKKSEIRLRIGDIVLVKNKFGAFASAIRSYCNCSFNHVAMIVNDSKLRDSVYLGAQPDKIEIRPLSHYFNKKLYAIRVIRLNKLSTEDLKKIVYEALSSIKYSCNPLEYMCKYSLLILRNLFKGLKKYEFSGAFTCSQLIANEIYKVTEYKINGKLPIDVHPGDFEKEPHKVLLERK